MFDSLFARANRELFRRDPRGYAIDLVEQGLVSPQTMLEACLSYMSWNDVRGMLDANELTPRFDEEYEDEECEE